MQLFIILSFFTTERLLHLSICISFSHNQAEHEPIECVHTSILRTHSLCYRNREYKKMKAFPFFKPSNQVKHAPFYIRIAFIKIVRLGITEI